MGAFLLHRPNARGRAIQADHILVSAVREHFAVYILRAADGFGGSGAGSRGAVHGALERDADFVLILGLLVRRIDQHAKQNDCSNNDNYSHLKLAICHFHLKRIRASTR